MALVISLVLTFLILSVCWLISDVFCFFMEMKNEDFPKIFITILSIALYLVLYFIMEIYL